LVGLPLPLPDKTTSSPAFPFFHHGRAGLFFPPQINVFPLGSVFFTLSVPSPASPVPPFFPLKPPLRSSKTRFKTRHLVNHYGLPSLPQNALPPLPPSPPYGATSFFQENLQHFVIHLPFLDQVISISPEILFAFLLSHLIF